jgi:hypothetical protein
MREVRPCGRKDVLFSVLEIQFCCAVVTSSSIKVNFFIDGHKTKLKAKKSPVARSASVKHKTNKQAP